MNSEQIKILTNIIGGVESGGQIYGKRRYEAYAGAYANNKNEVTCTLGWAQNYGSNAKKLVQRIFDRDKAAFRTADTAGIEAKLKKDWVAIKWNPSTAEKAALVKIITTPAGKAVQDEMFAELAERYILHAEEYGVTDVAAQMMWCEIEHLGGLEPTKRIFGRAAKPLTPKSIYSSLLLDQKDTSNNNQVGDKIYQSRHECCVQWIGQYLTGAAAKPEEKQATEIERIYAIAKAEVGYLEKATNAYLDDKTKNAGYNNYTKYWRDSRLAGMMASYGYPASSNFAGGVDWPYCADGVFWAFMKALGVARAQELLLHNGAAFINCETMYQKAKAAGRLVAKPQAGAVVLFKKSGNHYHTEFCYAVKDGIMYTIGWNTSGASSVIANGGGVCDKRYTISSVSADYFMPKYKEGAAAIIVDPGTAVTLLKYGSSGSAVKDMQKKLISLGFSCGSCGADGDFGNDTLKAVKAFQKANNLSVDGIYGENTARALNIAYEQQQSGKSKDPVDSAVLFVGKIKSDGVDVRTWAGREYGNIKSWPKLNKENLVDVLDYTQKAADGEEWYFVRITDNKTYKYHGFVQKKNIERA